MTENATYDQLWISGIRLGDRKIFDEMATALFRPLLDYALSITRSESASKDVVQDVMLQVWERRTAWQPECSVRAYLFGAVRNRALNEVRDRHTDRRLELDRAPDLVSKDGHAADVVELADLTLAYRNAVSRMPDRRQAVFTLSRIYGLSYAEVAAALGISINTVRTQMTDALKELRVALADYL